MLMIFAKAEQLNLFDMPVQVAGSVDKLGHVRRPHMSTRKKRLNPETHHAPVSHVLDRLDSFILSHGGPDQMRAQLAPMTPEQRAKLIDAMAHVGGISHRDVMSRLGMHEPIEAKPIKPSAEAKPIEPVSSEPHGPIVEHQTKRRLLRGVIRRDLDEGRAKAIDPYAFRKDGGWFIREKHVGAPATAAAPVPPPPPPPAPAPAAVEQPAAAETPIGPFGVPAGISKAARRAINARVVDLLASGKDEYSDEDRALFRQYSGNGGCGDSLNEYYTDPAVAQATWTVLRGLGIDHGTALEPSCGNGVFLHTAPAGMKVTGVEIESISADAAKALHGDRHEIINASLERFATQDDRQFDVVIGNAPFGLRGSLIKDDKPHRSTAEGYFMDASLDKCKPGGVVAMIVPTGVIDAKSNRRLRLDLLRKGQFLGALRMPNTAFEHSHTEVTTDIVFFKKRGDDVAGALSTLNQDQLKALGVWDDEYLSGRYFEGRGAASVMGSMEPGWRAKAGMGQDITVAGSMIGVPDAIAKWTPDDVPKADPGVTDVLSSLGDDQTAKDRALGAAVMRPYQLSSVGDTKSIDGITYILQGKPPRWHRIDELLNVESVTDAEPIAAEIDKLFNGQAVNRPALEAAVRAYVEKHGIPANDKALQLAAGQNKALYRLIGAVQPDGTLSDAVLGLGDRRVSGSLDTVAQSLALESGSGTFTIAELIERSGQEREDVEDALYASTVYAYAGDGQWTTMDQYVTGELWPKMDYVRERIAAGDLKDGLAQRFALQEKKLEETIDPKSLEDVEIMVNSAFMPTKVVASFFNERNAGSANTWLNSHTDLSIQFDGGLYVVEGGDMNTRGLLDKYLNRTGVRKDDMPVIDRMNADFKLWLLSSQHRDQVEDLYNRKFRGFVPRAFSNAPIDIPGLNDAGLKAHIYGGLRWALAARKGIVADDVGLGKTVQGLMLARMAKVLGNAKKPMFVVPKSVLANWVSEAEKWFPGTRVLVIGETYTRDEDGKLLGKSDTAAERNRKLHDMTQNDYDFVFISQPAFNDIDLDPIKKGDYVNDDFWVQRGDKLGNAGDKRLRKVREAYEQAVAGREFQKRTYAIYFNDLNVDMLLVDEGHAFKNLYAARARFGESPKFLGGQGLSNRALDMNLKTRWVREQNQGNGVYLLTATPTKNSPLEIYSMLSHIAPEAFERIGIRNSEEFLDRFCEFRTENILATDGTIKEALVTVGFKNLSELREIMKRHINRRTAVDVGLKLPERDDHMHMIDMSEQQQAVYADLRDQLHENGKKDSTGDAHIFSIMDKMAKAAMDLELLDPRAYAGATSPKYEAIASRVSAGAKEGGQIVFSEAVDSHEKIAAALVAAGIPRKQIAIINAQEAESSAKRQNIADDLNAGRIKVVIGNKTMEEGVNLQKSTTDIHNLDLPWEPATMQQRIGRGLRQGNLNKSVRIHTYISKGSFDGYRYQSMMAKKDWQDMLWNGGDRVENMAREGRFDRSDLMIMMSADPEAERTKLAANKAAAEEAHAGVQRKEAASEFVRFQTMKRSYNGLKNKQSTSAERLRANLDRAKTLLANNKHFSAKAALDSDTEVLIHPATGHPIQAGVGLEIKDGNGDHGKWVVTGVDITDNQVTMRRYGALSAHGNSMSVSAVDLAADVKPFKFDQAEESAEVKTKLDSEAHEKAQTITDWKQIKEIPSHVIEASHDRIQQQLWDGVKSYKLSAPYGKVPLIHKETGKVELAESYDLRGDKDKTHDFVLPIDKHRDALLHAWMTEERGARYSTHMSSPKRGRSTTRAVKDYPSRSYSDQSHTNPMDSALADAHGQTHSSYGTSAPIVKQAREQLGKEQLNRVHRAKALNQALAALMPIGELQDSHEENKASVKYPKRALAMVWAKARQLGLLGMKFQDHEPKTRSKHDTELGHHGYAYGGQRYQTVHNTLISMAKRSGHRDLAAAMAQSGLKNATHSTDEGTLGALAEGHGHSADELRALHAVAEHTGIAGQRLGARSLPGVLSTHSWSSEENMTVREKIAARLAQETEKEVA